MQRHERTVHKDIHVPSSINNKNNIPPSVIGKDKK